jgi:hypothetical protein
MATQYIDLDSTTDRQSLSLTASGTVTNTVRLHYDDTKTKAEIILAAQRAMEALIELID